MISARKARHAKETSLKRRFFSWTAGAAAVAITLSTFYLTSFNAQAEEEPWLQMAAVSVYKDSERIAGTDLLELGYEAGRQKLLTVSEAIDSHEKLLFGEAELALFETGEKQGLVGLPKTGNEYSNFAEVLNKGTAVLSSGLLDENGSARKSYDGEDDTRINLFNIFGPSNSPKTLEEAALKVGSFTGTLDVRPGSVTPTYTTQKISLETRSDDIQKLHENLERTLTSASEKVDALASSGGSVEEAFSFLEGLPPVKIGDSQYRVAAKNSRVFTAGVEEAQKNASGLLADLAIIDEGRGIQIDLENGSLEVDLLALAANNITGRNAALGGGLLPRNTSIFDAEMAAQIGDSISSLSGSESTDSIGNQTRLILVEELLAKIELHVSLALEKSAEGEKWEDSGEILFLGNVTDFMREPGFSITRDSILEIPEFSGANQNGEILETVFESWVAPLAQTVADSKTAEEIIASAAVPLLESSSEEAETVVADIVGDIAEVLPTAFNLSLNRQEDTEERFSLATLSLTIFPFEGESFEIRFGEVTAAKSAPVVAVAAAKNIQSSQTSAQTESIGQQGLSHGTVKNSAPYRVVSEELEIVDIDGIEFEPKAGYRYSNDRVNNFYKNLVNLESGSSQLLDEKQVEAISD